MVVPREVPNRFAVAFSLAGEQRELILPIAQEVEAVLGRSRVFYYDWYEHWIAGTDSDLLLQDLYGARAELVVVCVSEDYGRKPWTQTEHRAVRARITQALTPLEQRSILPIRVGEGDVAGVLFNDIVPDIRHRTPTEAAELIIGRLNIVRGTAAGQEPAALPRWPVEPPELQWPMADHSEARGAFSRLLSESGSARVLLIRGASETGKSHMSRQMIRNCLALAEVSGGRFDFKGTANISVEVEAMCQLLGIEVPTGNLLSERLGKILVELRRRTRPTVLIFDSYQEAGEAANWVENVLLPHAVSAPWLRVVIIGQSVPARVGTTWESVAEPPLTLQTPRPEHWLEYGRTHRGETVNLTFVTQVHQHADGKPSILALLLGPKD